MATIQLTIPDDKLTLVVDTLCVKENYQAEIPDPDWVDPGDGSIAPTIPNPMTRAVCARRGLYRMIREEAVQQEANTQVQNQKDVIDALRQDLSVIDE